MAAKEPTVEPCPCAEFGDITSRLELIRDSLNAETARAAAEKAWDEGVEALHTSLMSEKPYPIANPYRLPSEPAKGDGNGE